MKVYALVLFLFAAVSGVFAQTAVLTEIQGTVDIRRTEGNWQKARTGDELSLNEQISTGFKSSAVLRLGASTLYLKPLTRLSIAELVNQNNKESASVNFITGRVRADIKPPTAGSRVEFSIKSPVATASVRGTIFEFNGRRLDVIEGRVLLSATNRTASPVVIINSGESGIINKDVPEHNGASPLQGRKEVPAVGGIHTHAEPAASPPMLGNDEGNLTIEIKPGQ